MNLPKLVVYKSDELVNAIFSLRQAELNVFDYILGKLNQTNLKENLPDVHRIYVKDFADRFHYNDTSYAYKVLNQVCSDLVDQHYYLKEGYTKVNWVEYISYDPLEKWIDVKFTPTTIDLIFNFTERFLKFDLINKSRLNSFYSSRFYEWFRKEIFKERQKATVLLKIDKIRKHFCLENKYPLYANLKDRVILPSIEDINYSTDLIIELKKEHKVGKKVVKIEFEVIKRPFGEMSPMEHKEWLNNLKNKQINEQNKCN